MILGTGHIVQIESRLLSDTASDTDLISVHNALCIRSLPPIIGSSNTFPGTGLFVRRCISHATPAAGEKLYFDRGQALLRETG
jgi:hypothetical protein